MSEYMIENIVSSIWILKQSWENLNIAWITEAVFLLVKFRSILQT